MDRDQVRAVVSWIKSHPKHSEEFKGDNASTIFLKFLTDPELICDYEDPNENHMLGETVEDGCNYVFLKSRMMHMPCNQRCDDGKGKCKFHSDPIFSDEVRNFIRQYHLDLNKICEGL